MSRSTETVIAAGMLTIAMYVFALSAVAEKFMYVKAEAHEPEAPVTVEIIEVPKNAEVEWIEHLYREAAKHGADPEKLIKTAECESRWKPSAIGDGGRSRGVFQIHDGYHDVAPEDAHDPYFSIEWAAEKFGENQGRLWTCFRSLFGNSSSTI